MLIMNIRMDPVFGKDFRKVVKYNISINKGNNPIFLNRGSLCLKETYLYKLCSLYAKIPAFLTWFNHLIIGIKLKSSSWVVVIIQSDVQDESSLIPVRMLSVVSNRKPILI